MGLSLIHSHNLPINLGKMWYFNSLNSSASHLVSAARRIVRPFGGPRSVPLAPRLLNLVAEILAAARARLREWKRFLKRGADTAGSPAVFVTGKLWKNMGRNNDVRMSKEDQFNTLCMSYFMKYIHISSSIWTIFHGPWPVFFVKTTDRMRPNTNSIRIVQQLHLNIQIFKYTN